jgi:C4-dicarboxylate transporter DctM subunit
VWVIATRRNYPLQPWRGLRALAIEAWRALPIVVLPAIILGGILSGAFTPTEAAIVAAAYAFLVGKFLLGTLRWGDIVPILIRVGADSSRLMLILCASSAFAWILARESVPQELASLALAISDERRVILLLVNLLLLLLGTFLEPVILLVLLVPILDPLIRQVGIDPVHFGVVITLNLMIGLLTPPVGSVMFITMAIANVSMAELTRECWPFILMLLLIVVTYVPWTVMVVPDLYGHTANPG